MNKQHPKLESSTDSSNKSHLPTSSPPVYSPTGRSNHPALRGFNITRVVLFVIGLSVTLWTICNGHASFIMKSCRMTGNGKLPVAISADSNSICHQVDPLVPSVDGNPISLDYFRTPEFRNWSLAVLQDAVRIPTESFDDLGEVGKDPRWEIFFEFEKTLKKSFPLVHKYLDLEHVNTHGLVYTWKGSDDTLKPALFMAHQDVVPVLPESRDLWTYDPYEAYFDGEKIWGRGTTDMKGSLVGILIAVETLLKQHGGQLEGDDSTEIPFSPRRTIILGFGFDEEISGNYGAAYIAKHLEHRYGPGGLDSIIDEGGLGVTQRNGVNLALPGVAEKGMYDISVELNTPGGHSSIPPDHTAIGIVGALATLMEKTPFTPALPNDSPVLDFLKCLAVNSPSIPDDFKSAILNADKSSAANKAVVEVLSKNPRSKYMIQTSQAIDIINGGLKINALPEKVTLTANYRIGMGSSVASTRDKVVQNALSIAHEFDVGVLVKKTDGELVTLKEKTPHGYFVVSDFGTYIEPSPITATNTEAWATLSGTIRYVYQDFAGPIIDPENPDDKGTDHIVVGPAYMVANTDTKHYWTLTDNIYRFSPVRFSENSTSNIHTVDEFSTFETYLEGCVFYYAYMLNL